MTKKHITLFFILILMFSKSIGQCVITCNQNVGVFSNNDPSTIGYDNMTSSFHSSIASEELGFRVWGENMLNIGTAHALSPIYINSTNYPALTGTVYFAGVGSNSILDVQLIVLTSTGLFASGYIGAVLSPSIKNTTSFSKITVNGKTDGLPFGITPDSVKMMFVSFQTIIITTCGGNVYVLSQYSNIRGDIGTANQWNQVKMTNGQPLTGIIAARGNSSFAFALKNDNTLWTWGDQLRMGNGSATFSSNFAVQMTPPSGVSKIKMIQGTSFGGNQSYFVLDTSNKVYALGDNTRGQLADNTSVNRNVWVNCLYSSGGIVNNAKWISSNEHDPINPNIGIINTNSQMRTAGNNSRWMIGRTSNGLTNNLNFPTGISPTDTIMFCEVGGHTSAFIKKNTTRYGYVGHHVNGSIGNNSSLDNEITSVNFIIPPIISICGTVCDTPIISKKPFNCNDSIATFIIKGRRNNIIRFNINGVNDSIVIANNDTAIISRLKPSGDLALNITQINSVYCNLSLAIKDTLKLNTKKDSFLSICRNKSIIFNQQVINNSGVYRDTLINVFGCDSFVNLFLTILDTSKKDSFLTICQPNSIIFNNQTIGISGIYKDTFINSKGCDSILTLNLTVNPRTFGIINQSICQGNSFLFNGINRTISGTYLDTLINSKGCDSILTLNLSINTTTFGSINQTICQGNSFLFNGINRTISGTYLDTLINSKGCDSILTLNLTVNPITFGTINQTICQGNSFLFNGINRTISGTYLDTLINSKGCDSILTLNLTVNPITFGTINQAICQGSSFLFNGMNRTTSGAYLDTLVNANGCDSILTLNLTVNPKTFGTINQSICQGSSFLFNGLNRTTSGAYLDTLVNANGCDSILTLNLTVNPKTFGTINQSICQGSSFLFNGMNRTISGTYLDTLINSKGCDSILTLNLSVNTKTFGTTNQTICQGQSFLGRTTSGTYIDTLLGANSKGCDSIRTLVLTVNPKTFGTISQTICQGNTFLFNGMNRTISGTYLDTLINSKGCDSILTLNLTVNPKTFGSFSQTICEGNSFLFNGINRTVSGVYLDTLVNVKGCDSIVTLNLTVNPKTFGTINQSICQGNTFLFNGMNRTTSGAYLDTLVNANGCDSILTLNLTINPKTFGTISQTICQGNSFLFNGINRIVSGIYLDTLVNAKGCDSILTLNLTVNSKTTSTINQTICEGSSFLGRTTSGTYIDTLLGANAKGCDSIRTLVLIVNPKTFGAINQTICQGNSFLFNGINRSVSGTYLDTLINAKGCDSILTLNLIVNPKTFGSFSQTICEGSSFLFNGINRTVSGVYLDTLVNAKGCDSIVTLNLTVNPKTFGSFSQTICEGSSFLFNGISRTISGAYLDTLVNAKGCDSILTLNLTVNPKTFGTINQSICQGNSFLFNGINRIVSGIYLDTLVNAKGCDSILTLNLTVNSKTTSTINQTICEGSSFLGRITSGTYIDTLLGANANGCDSIRTLILTVKTTTYSNFNQTICEGESFFNRIKSGFYSDTLINAQGCDSVRNLVLIVNPISKTIINKNICEGDIFLGKSNTGRYLDTFKNRFGCDSVREINLWVTSVNRKTLNYSICDGESFRGRTKTSIFIDTIKNNLGCDSIIETVDLYVRPNIDSSFKIKICDGRSYRGKTTAGNYVDSFVNDYGCISIYRYELSLKARSVNNETKTICNDQKYKGYTKSGIYSDTFINQNGCDSIITLTLFVKPNFIAQKLKDTTIKKGDSVLLQAQKGFLYYTWNTKTTRSEIMVSEAGKYKVTIMNQDGCIAFDSCNVFMIPKDTSNTDTTIIDTIDGYAECPNIFTPNDDFKNDLFRPNIYGEVEVIRLMVYSRLGEKMFEGHSNFSAWDGYYKGEKCEPGVYVYFMEFKNKKGNHFVKGSITLLR